MKNRGKPYTVSCRTPARAQDFPFDSNFYYKIKKKVNRLINKEIN
jgi:hypothetical protein